MQLDFTQLKSKFEELSSTLKPMPHKNYVESYIKAYYYPENSLEEWIKEHKVVQRIYFVNVIILYLYNSLIFRNTQ